jgi:hypothetical protein
VFQASYLKTNIREDRGQSQQEQLDKIDQERRKGRRTTRFAAII